MQSAEPFYATESRPRRTRWRIPVLIASVLAFLALPLQDWGFAQISGFYFGRIDNPSTGTLGLRVYLQQIGDSVTGNLTLSSTYAYKETVRQAKLSGQVRGSRFSVQGNLEGGGTIFLEGRPGWAAKVYRLAGRAHFEGCKESQEPAPFELKKVLASQLP